MTRTLDRQFTKKDFHIDWFSGSGSGGQHRNKHQNCCRITHLETGLSAIGTSSKSRTTNLREAFSVLAKRLVAHYYQPAAKKINEERIRTYHEPRNEVLDHLSGLSMSFKEVVENTNLGPMIEARRERNHD